MGLIYCPFRVPPGHLLVVCKSHAVVLQQAIVGDGKIFREGAGRYQRSVRHGVEPYWWSLRLGEYFCPPSGRIGRSSMLCRSPQCKLQDANLSSLWVVVGWWDGDENIVGE